MEAAREEGNMSDEVSAVKISARVRKLLALAHNKAATPNEVEVAARMAQELMQEHRLSEVDIVADDGSMVVDLPAGADGFMASWKFALVTSVARAFFCEAVGLRASRRRKVRIVGRREDAETVLSVFAFLCTEIERLAALVGGEEDALDLDLDSVLETLLGTTLRQRRDAYRSGMAAGVASTLREQARKFARSSEKALVLVRKNEEGILAHMKKKFGTPKETLFDAGKNVHLSDFERGYVRGKEIEVSPRREIGGKRGS
jgi:hypothetical protein